MEGTVKTYYIQFEDKNLKHTWEFESMEDWVFKTTEVRYEYRNVKDGWISTWKETVTFKN